MVYRMTPQRAKILEYLKSTKSHPSAEMVYDAIKDEMPGMSLATVYRNLQHLANEGQILRFCVGKESRYDGDNKDHAHFVCKECDAVVDVEFDAEIGKRVFDEYNKKKDLSIESVQLFFFGYCGECNKQDKK